MSGRRALLPRTGASWLKMTDYSGSQNSMENLPQAVVTPSAYLTLHYRLASQDGNDIVTTFNGNPATLQIGSG